jgi:hypothetical protein
MIPRRFGAGVFEEYEMTSEEFDAKFKAGVAAGKAFTDSHKRLMLFLAGVVLGFVVGAVSCSSKAATINVSGTTTDVPQCSTLSATAQNQVANLAVGCGSVTPPPPPIPPGPGCAGFQANPVEILWPPGHNINQPLPFFGPTTALVVHFKVTGAVGDTALFTLGNTSGPNYNLVRASLAAIPGCNTPTIYPPPSPVMWASVSQNPPLSMIVGVVQSGKITVQPNTDYWVTIVNRNGYPGVNSCGNANCGTNRRIDFNN